MTRDTVTIAPTTNLVVPEDVGRSSTFGARVGAVVEGDWLNVVPSPSLGLRLQDREFRCSLRYWLGVPLHNCPYPCPECRGTADIFGDHKVGCGGSGDRISRHNNIRDVVFTAAQSAAFAPSKEAPGLVTGSLSRPADVFLPSWSCGRPRRELWAA